jgi:hypothetical protein
MKHILVFIPLLTMLTACDAPQRTRAPSTYITNNPYTGSTTSGSLTPTTPTTGTTTGGTTGGTTGTTTGSSPGFENCDLTANKGYAVDVGNIGVCQSTQDETVFKFRPTLTSLSVRTCLIPTYRDSSGASTYIGNPQCAYTTANQIIQGKLYKDRTGFSQYPINGVIVMKEPLLPEYIGCMQGYINWPSNACPNGVNSSQYCAYWGPRCPYGSKTNASCDTEGRNYMANVCNSFKSKYSNSYIDIGTR